MLITKIYTCQKIFLITFNWKQCNLPANSTEDRPGNLEDLLPRAQDSQEVEVAPLEEIDGYIFPELLCSPSSEAENGSDNAVLYGE